MSYPSPDYYPQPAAPAYVPRPPWTPPPAEEVDLTTLPLDELLERYAYARRAHQDHLSMLDDVEKRGAHLRDREQQVKRALVSALREQWKVRLRDRLVGGEVDDPDF